MEVKNVEVYDNGVVIINFSDGESMIVSNVYYMDAVLSGWDESDVGIKR